MAGVLVFKAIKPDRLKEDAMRLALLNPMRKMVQDIYGDFKKTTATWQHKVEFERSISLALGGASVHVITSDKIYGFVNDGTRAHPIFAGYYTGLSSKKALSFQWGGKGSYRAKTTPRIIGSQPGGPSGPRVAMPYVQHPGNAARAFDETIREKWEPIFKSRIEQAMSEAAKASGHSI